MLEKLRKRSRAERSTFNPQQFAEIVAGAGFGRTQKEGSALGGSVTSAAVRLIALSLRIRDG
jgi:hypothetical protein